MKKLLSFILSCFVLLISSAQVPYQVNYQGIARNSVGNVLPNKAITVRLSVRDGSASGTVVYTETRNVSTNAFGLFFYGIGSAGATSVTGTLGAVNWATGNKYLQVEIDPNGGNSFTDAGTTQLLSVPYAIYAAGAPPTGNAGGSLTGTYPDPIVANGAITSSMIAAGVIPTTLPPSGPAGGSLTGTYPNPTVANGAILQSMIAAGVTLPPNGPAGGSLTGNYPNPLIANGAVTQAMIAPGVTLPPSGVAGGDLSGNYPNPTVSRLQGRPVNNTVPVINNVLGFNGTSWEPVSLASNPDNVWTLNGINIYNNNTGNVGIGINNPAYKLHVAGGHANFSDSVIARSMRVGPGANTAIRAIGTRNGVIASGSEEGVRGSGENGVVGDGSFSGVSGQSQNGKGVYGNSINGIGVYGFAPTGVKGEGSNYGVEGTSDQVGVIGEGLLVGVGGIGEEVAVYGDSFAGFGVRGSSFDNFGGYFSSETSYGLVARTYRSDINWAGVFYGNVYAFGAYQTSDGKLKKDIQDLGNAMNIIKQLKPRTYAFKQDGNYSTLNLPIGKHYGLIAQELELVMPNLVKEVKYNHIKPDLRRKEEPEKGKLMISKEKNTSENSFDFKTINYTELIPIMIKGMQEQQQMIDELKKEIELLKKKVQ